MGSWIDAYLQDHPDLAERKVLARSRSATHFELAPGIARAVVTGSPQYFRENGDWQALDPSLRADSGGRLGAPGIEARFRSNGQIDLPGKAYSQRSLGLGTLSAGRYSKQHDLPGGRVRGARLLREVGAFRHECVLLETGLKEQLVVLEVPAGLEGDYLVYETALPSGSLPVGEWESEQVNAEGLRFPPGHVLDAQGKVLPFYRLVREEQGGQRAYSGVPLAALETASFPVTIDPSLNFTGSTADGYVYGYASTYSTARATSTGYDSGWYLEVGQALESAIPRYYTYRSFLKFDLSSIDPNLTLLSATLGLALYADYSGSVDFDVQVVKQNWSASDPLSDGNREAAYDACLSGAQDVVWRNTAGIATGVHYLSPPLDMGYLNFGGASYLSLRGSRDYTANPPLTNGNEYVLIYSAENGGASTKPVLVVDYAVVFPVAFAASLPPVKIGTYDTRIKLRARERDRSLTTVVRSEDQ